MTGRKNNRIKGHVDALATGFKYLAEPNRMTLNYPDESMNLKDNYRGFFAVKDKTCIGCSLCEIVCPPKAISMLDLSDAGGKKKKRPMIDWGLCIFCYFCVDICPTDAFQTSQVHDKAFYSEAEYQTVHGEPMQYPYDYSKRPDYKEIYESFHDVAPDDPSAGSKKVVPKFDKKRGIKYEHPGQP
ncbi:MAG: 4Fe-4S dicluster domain-containing protein [Nitrososphaerota archaeon]|nr:4Fe-4S dicluster domain-containing protein [Nitrososphaerota archaeon]MDG7041430.1 4Fe-4S dicluster domain-containing protein [Nitrososphaerota archaeon]MDG7045250.1 4Fe-4S dicluster domain-containing protein [Nitrososphaerota archaeon]